MAYDYFSDDERKKEVAEGEPTGQGEKLGEQSPVVTGGQQEQQEPGAGTASGSFTNLQKYLDANQSLNFGQQVAGKVQNEINQAGTQQNTSEGAFKGKADQNTVGMNQGVIDRVNTDPTGLVADKSNFDNFTKMRDASYGGPKNFADDAEDYSNAYGSTDKAYQTSEQTKNEGGRKAYLDEQYGAGQGRYDYAPGMKKLDNFLIQNDEGSKAAFDKTQQSGQNLKANFDTLNQRLNAYAGQAQNTTQQARSAARGSLGIDDAGNEVAGKGAIGGLKTDVQKSLQQRLSDQQNQYAQTQKAFQDKKLSELGDLQNKFAIDPNTSLYGLNPSASKYLSTPADINEQTVANSDQYSKMAALAQLAGQNNTYLPDPSLAGKYSSGPLVNFNNQAWQQDTSQAKSALDTDIGNLQTQAAQIRSKAQPWQDYWNSVADRNKGGTTVPLYLSGQRGEMPEGLDYNDFTTVQDVINYYNNKGQDFENQIEPLKTNRGAYDKWT